MILIVDDEPGIRHVLEGMLTEEGYKASSVDSGEAAFKVIEDSDVDLVLLDIWMPGRDGMQVLKEIKERFPKIKVIMMSGHASISTAVRATQLGATDFLEKPLDSEGTLRVIKNALENLSTDIGSSHSLDLEPGAAKKLTGNFNTEVFRDNWSRGEKFRQKTLARSAVLYGQGLHSGKRSGLLLEPLPENSGIHFVGVSDDFPVPAHVGFVESTGWATTLRLGKTQAGTIEHLMSALHAYGISNLLIKCNHEVPVMDGSAIEFCELFDRVGLVEQDADWYAIRVDKPFEIKKGEEFIRIEPDDQFSVQYTLKYPKPLGVQEFTFTLSDSQSYSREISKARTFGFMRDLGKLQAQGLALGGRFDNCVLFGEDGSLNGELRYENEPVRHKILDAIGDLFLLGRRIQGKVIARMTGHSDNVAILKALWDARS